MISSQLVFRTEYRFDLRKIDSVLIPYLFDNDASLVVNIQSKSKLAKNYQKAGILNQILIDYPGKLIASTQEILLHQNYQINFPQEGRFQLEYKPYKFLGKCLMSISRIVVIDEVEDE